MKKTGMTKIWDRDVKGADRYLSFKNTFMPADGKTTLFVACDSIFTCRINGELVAFGACQNYPFAKPYRTFDVTDAAKKGGEFELVVWHQGLDSQTGIKMDAFAAFRIVCNGKTLAESGKDTLCAVVAGYENGRKKIITTQLGYGYGYDFTREGKEIYAPATVCGEGEFYEWELDLGGKPDQIIYPPAPATITKTDFGYMSDLGKETVGYLHLEADCDRETELIVSYGEHLDSNGRVPRIMWTRDFSATIKCRKGKNVFDGLFRRFAGRFLEVEGEGATVTSLTLSPVERAVAIKPRKFDDPDFQKIYDTSVYTLICSMHDHYEDCPWREQALYTLDSRNQMLCGYYAFGGFDFQRQNLLLISKGLYNGLLSLCYPMAEGLAIPFFSLVYPVQVAEYVRYSGDREILTEVGETVKTIMKTFSARVEKNGLIPSFPYPYWNFYEWTDGSANGGEIERKPSDPFDARYDTILNCAYVLAVKACDEIFGTTTDTSMTVAAIRENLFDTERGVYPLAPGDDRASILSNAIAILAGAGDEKLAEKIVSDESLIPVTLSMCTYYYDALLSFGDKYRDFIVADIKKKYFNMLSAGATTFWETELGAEDFGGAGSLCHGWSAIPVYYLCLLTGQKA